MASGGIHPWRHTFWLSVELLKVYVQKTQRQQYYLPTLPRPLTTFTEERWCKFYLHMAYQKKPVLYRNTNVKVCSPHGDTDYFDIVAGVLQGDTLVQEFFIIHLDYVLLIKSKKTVSSWQRNEVESTPSKILTDADYSDDKSIRPSRKSAT